jgi:uncharacterized RDD family membrane protein YckC
MVQEQQSEAKQVAVAENVTGPRIVAAIIDIVILAVSFVILGALMGDTEAGDGNFAVGLNGLPALLFFLLALAYYTVPEALTGKTPGKAIMGLKVVKLDGEYSWGPAIVRNLLRIIDGLPVFYLLGFILIAVSSKNQRLGDMLAGTIVVRGR